MTPDEKVLIIDEKMPDDFERRLNEVLAEGGWRVAETEVYVTNHHYFALLIKSAPLSGNS